MSRPLLTNAAARAIFLDRHMLVAPPSGPGRGEDLAQVIRDLGFVQVDSVNTLARAHDMILWSRRQQYRPANLAPLLKQRQVFEHWTHDAAIVPMEYFPHWRHNFDRHRAHMDRKWVKWQGEDYRRRFDEVLQKVADYGPVTAAEARGEESHKSGGWWEWHPSKSALEYLWRAGELSITRRESFRKVYDLTERVIPAGIHQLRTEVGETVDWVLSQAMDRLGFATPGELWKFFDIATPQEAKVWTTRGLADGSLIEVDVEGADGTLRPSLARPELLDEVPPVAGSRVRVLSPFDPALRDRARAERLFGFFYRIEIFVPAPKRQYGYYVFPVMEATRVIGRLDAKREGDCLAVTAYWPEKGGKLGKGRENRLMAELERVARMGGCGHMRFAPGWRR
ncbi:winged helix-turn-helix domain-containing protein [Pelagovum pacificum]|uniref:Winged helix-turn-helix domain-containing protein n=1 Tax=Pelagovum pacificum TaxID=2588711 RepID=A0A5C5GKC4_9RHOB|nr:crosslink repair DNA glycosylase YcaQ family protein [Pelagovum pacificum]QQA42598.1 YcaQ family DNA glycosylase [Pelagovum pacificum]TNY34251.1 winged helix-turn-helix domain-containing protein [Pelagovum pacificum]